LPWTRLLQPLEARARAVAQPGAHAQLRIQHRGEAPAENRVHQVERGAARIGARDADIADPEIRLHGIGRIDQHHAASFDAGGRRHGRQRRRGLAPLRECLRQQTAHLRRLEVARDGDDESIAADMGGIELANVIDRDVRKRAFAADHRIAVRVRAEERGGGVDRRERIALGVLRRANEFDIAIAQDVELVRGEMRSLQHVGQQLDHELLVASEKRAADPDRFRGGARLNCAADCGNGLREGERIARAGASLEQPGEQIRDAEAIARIEAGAAAHARIERDERDVVPLHEQKHSAVRELDAFIRRRLDAAVCLGERAREQHERRDEHANGRGNESCACEHHSSPAVARADAAESTPTVRLVLRKNSAATFLISSPVTASYAFGASNKRR